MKLQLALGISLRIRGAGDPEVGAACTRALEIAESLENAEYQLRALWSLWSGNVHSGQIRIALALAQRFCTIAAKRPERMLGERMMGVTGHFLGDQIGARRHLEHVLTHHATIHPGRDFIRFQDVARFGTVRLSARVYLARVLWLQGFPDQAVHLAAASLGEAQATGHAVSICYALANAACPIALWVGNLTAATVYTGMLLDHSKKHGLPHWSARSARFQGVIDIRDGDLDTALQLPQAGIDGVAEPNFSFRFLTGLNELAEALTRAGRIAEGLAVVERIEQSEADWLRPELLRLKGELFLLRGNPADREIPEDLFRQALDVARRQEALSWELRAATSLSRLLRDQSRSADAKALLQPVYGRFTEGFETADLKAAKALLDALASGPEAAE